MTPYEKRSCKMTRRLAEDMKIRNLAPATIDAYTFHARCFGDFIQKPLDRATVEDVRNFQLHLIEIRKLAYSSFNQAVCALRFLYTHLLTISRLLGHASFTTTMVYLHCRREHLGSIPSPLDWLPVQQLPTYRPAQENGPSQEPNKGESKGDEPNGAESNKGEPKAKPSRKRPKKS